MDGLGHTPVFEARDHQGRCVIEGQLEPAEHLERRLAGARGRRRDPVAAHRPEQERDGLRGTARRSERRGQALEIGQRLTQPPEARDQEPIRLHRRIQLAFAVDGLQ